MVAACPCSARRRTNADGEFDLAGIRLTDRPADFAVRLDAELKPVRRQKTLLIADDAPEIVSMLSQQARCSVTT